MIIKITKATMASGQYVKPGDIVNVSDEVANILINMGKAEKSEPAPVIETQQLDTNNTSAVIAEKPKRGRKPKGIKP